MPSLLDPLTIGSLKTRNRLVLPPMMSRKADADGYPTDSLVQYYAGLSEGAGITVIEHTYVVEWGRVQTQLGVSDDKFIPGLTKLTQAIHARGVATVIQLNHAGYNSSSQVLGKQPTAPSAVRNPRNEKAEIARSITRDEIQTLIGAFASAARRSIDAGFDGVEVHCSHGFLLGEFLSPITNKRTDEYGGSTENRVSLPIQVVKAVKQAVDKDFPVFCRFPAGDMMPGGLELPEGIRMAKVLVEAGVDVVDVGGGIGGIEPPGTKEQGFFVPQAEAIKKATGAVVVGVGGIVDPTYADRIVREGRVDLVAVGRPLLKDPTWFTKAIQSLSKGL